MTSNAPHWFVLACIAVGIGAYTLCGLLVLAARAHRWLTHRPATAVGSTRQPQRPRGELVTGATS